MSLEDEVKEIVYDPTLPVDVVFNKIDFFANISKYTDRNMSNRRKVQMAYLIVNRAGIFKVTSKTWNAHANNLKTYDELKVI